LGLLASSVTKILANKIVSLYLIFFSKIVYLYRFKGYIFEYCCPPLPRTHTNCTTEIPAILNGTNVFVNPISL
jgi:hypothetical protein